MSKTTKTQPVRFLCSVEPDHIKFTRIKQILSENFDDLMAQRVMNMAGVAIGPNFNWFVGGNEIQNFAKANGMGMFGHNLRWPYKEFWAAELKTLRSRVYRQHQFIDTMLTTYPEIVTWEGTNEMLDPNEITVLRTDDPFMSTKEADQYKSIDAVYRRAKSVRKNIRLLLSEAVYTMAQFNQLVKMATRLLEMGTPIDGISVQAHNYAAGHDNNELFEMYDALAIFCRQRKLVLVINELDLSVYDDREGRESDFGINPQGKLLNILHGRFDDQNLWAARFVKTMLPYRGDPLVEVGLWSPHDDQETWRYDDPRIDYMHPFGVDYQPKAWFKTLVQLRRAEAAHQVVEAAHG